MKTRPKSHHTKRGGLQRLKDREGSGSMRQATAEVKYYQETTNLLIKKIPFAKIIQQIVIDLWQGKKELYWKSTALLALQEAAEWYIICLFQDANLCARHAKRITVMNEDLTLVRRLRGKVRYIPD